MKEWLGAEASASRPADGAWCEVGAYQAGGSSVPRSEAARAVTVWPAQHRPLFPAQPPFPFLKIGRQSRPSSV